MVAEVYARDIALAPAFHILIGVHIIFLGEVGSRRMISRCNRPSHGQFARWIHLSCQDVGHRVTAFNTGLPCHEDGIHTVAPTCCFHDRSRVDDDNHLLAFSMEGIRNTENHILFRLTEVELTIDLTVHTLTSLTSDGDDGGISLRLLIGHTALSYIDFIEFWLSLIQEPHHRILVCLELCLGIFHIVLIDFCELRSSSHTDVLQSSNHIYRITYIDSSTTKSTRHKVVGVDTEESHRLQATDRESCIVLQEHHTLGAALAGNGSMSLEVGLATIFIPLETWSLHDVFQHTAHVAVNVIYVQFARFHRVYYIFYLCRIARHHQVVASSHLLFYRQVFTLTNPVGLDNSLISPVVTQDIGQEIFVALCIDAVYLIICRHNSPWIALAHHHLKALEIKLTQSTLTQTLIHTGTVTFL